MMAVMLGSPKGVLSGASARPPSGNWARTGELPPLTAIKPTASSNPAATDFETFFKAQLLPIDSGLLKRPGVTRQLAASAARSSSLALRSSVLPRPQDSATQTTDRARPIPAT